MYDYIAGEYEVVASIPIRGDQFNARSVNVPGEVERYVSRLRKAKAKFIVVAPGARGSIGELHFDKLALISEQTP